MVCKPNIDIFSAISVPKLVGKCKKAQWKIHLGDIGISRIRDVISLELNPSGVFEYHYVHLRALISGNNYKKVEKTHK